MKAKILIIDHNDSFTFNLAGLFESFMACADETLVQEVTVWPVNELSSKSFEGISEFDAVVLSPGPGLPNDYPAVYELLHYCLARTIKIPVLGICLGMQTIITYFGGRLYNLSKVQHGRQVNLTIESKEKATALFRFMTMPVKVGLYHSWAMDLRTNVSELDILASAEFASSEGQEPGCPPVVMALAHHYLPVYGLQFHPESFMTPEGGIIIRNWLKTITALS